ncbi:MAG: thermonuclease family protein [Alphaproteobacteria bacterium]
MAWRFLAGLLLAVALAPPAAGAASLPGPVAADVVRVVDGDTLAVRARIWLDQAVETLVRIEGVDTPELRGSCAFERALAEQARDALARMVEGGAVSLVDVRHDKFGGRVRAVVLDAEGRNVADGLIAAGLARAYSGGRREPWCSDETGEEP